MSKVFFVLWFMMGSNTHTLTTMKLDTEAECRAVGRAMVNQYNNMYYIGTDMTEDSFKCLKVEVKE